MIKDNYQQRYATYEAYKEYSFEQLDEFFNKAVVGELDTGLVAWNALFTMFQMKENASYNITEEDENCVKRKINCVGIDTFEFETIWNENNEEGETGIGCMSIQGDEPIFEISEV